MTINDLKLISIIIHFSSIMASFNKSNNSFTCLFYEKNGNKIKDFESWNKLYWIATPDGEEFEILNSLKNYQFISFSDEDIAQNKWFNYELFFKNLIIFKFSREGKLGFGLYSKFYSKLTFNL